MNGNVILTSSAESSSPNTGSFVTYGGIGMGGSLNVSKNATISGNLSVLTNTTLNRVNITNTTPSTSAITGALTVLGGVGIVGSLNINERMNVGQTATFNTDVNVNGVLDSQVITRQGRPLNFYYVDVDNPQTVNGIKTFNNDIIFKSTTSSSNVYGGAITVFGGVGIQGNLNVGNDISSNGSFYLSGNASIGNNILTRGTLFVNNSSQSSDINTGSITTLGGVGIRGNLNVGGNVNISRNTIIAENTNILGNLCINRNVGIGIQTPSVALDVSGSINTTGIVKTNNIQSTGIMNIGFLDDTNTTQINIGNFNPSSLINIGYNTQTINIGKTVTNNVISQVNIGNPTGSTASTVNIGGDKDIVNIRGTVNITGGQKSVSQIVVYSKVAVFNIDQSGSQYVNLNYGVEGNTYTTDGAGIWINDLSVNNIGQFVVTADLNGFLFKAPTYKNTSSYTTEQSISQNPQYYTNNPQFPSQNILRLDVNGLVTNNSSSILILKPSTDNQTRYTITTSQIDLSNVLLKNKDSIAYPNTQVINTKILIGNDFSVGGNSLITNNSTINGISNFNGNVYSNNFTYLTTVGINKTNTIQNSSLDINGNVIVTKLGIGTTSVNTEPNSLEVQGNVIQRSGGFIWQF